MSYWVNDQNRNGDFFGYRDEINFYNFGGLGTRKMSSIIAINGGRQTCQIPRYWWLLPIHAFWCANLGTMGFWGLQTFSWLNLVPKRWCFNEHSWLQAPSADNSFELHCPLPYKYYIPRLNDYIFLLSHLLLQIKSLIYKYRLPVFKMYICEIHV